MGFDKNNVVVSSTSSALSTIQNSLLGSLRKWAHVMKKTTGGIIQYLDCLPERVGDNDPNAMIVTKTLGQSGVMFLREQFPCVDCDHTAKMCSVRLKKEFDKPNELFESLLNLIQKNKSITYITMPVGQLGTDHRPTSDFGSGLLCEGKRSKDGEILLFDANKIRANYHMDKESEEGPLRLEGLVKHITEALINGKEHGLMKAVDISSLKYDPTISTEQVRTEIKEKTGFVLLNSQLTAGKLDFIFENEELTN